MISSHPQIELIVDKKSPHIIRKNGGGRSFIVSILFIYCQISLIYDKDTFQIHSYGNFIRCIGNDGTYGLRNRQG